MVEATTFTLEDELDELRFNFTTKANPEGPSGIIPEPTATQIKRFQKAIRQLMGPALAELEKVQSMAPEDRVKRLTEENADNEEEAAKQLDKLLGAVADVCSNTPTKAQIKALPYRGQRAFMGWIVGVFLSPEAPAPATNS